MTVLAPISQSFSMGTVGCRGKAETVRTYHRSGVKYAVVAYFTSLVDLYSRIQDAVLAYRHALSDIDLRIDLSALADPGPAAYVREGSHIDPFAETGRPCHVGRKSPAVPLLRLHGVEKVQQ